VRVVEDRGRQMVAVLSADLPLRSVNLLTPTFIGHSCSLAMGESQTTFVRALHESTAIADRIREAIADAPPKLVMLALSDLVQEHLTRLVIVEARQGANAALTSTARRRS
jgi:hypothetical protein